MKKSLIIILLFPLVMILSHQPAYALGIEGAVGVWNQDPRGYMSYKGDSLSVDRELHYDQETKVMARIKIDMPLFIPNIYLMYTPIKFEGRGEKATNFKFGSVTFRGNTPFQSEIRLTHYDIALYYGIPLVKTATAGMLNIDLGLDCRILDLKASIDQPSTNLHESKSMTVPIPMGYIGVEINPLKYLHLEGEVRGIGYNGNGYYDLIGRIKIIPFGPFFISAGYRYEKLKIDHLDVDSDIEVKGPFVEVGFSF